MILKGKLGEAEFREESLNGNLLRIVVALGIPLAFYYLFNGLFGLLDTIMASHIGSLEVSSISYLSQLQNLMTSLGQGLVSGAMISVNQAYGKGDDESVRKSINNLFTLLSVIIVLLLLMIPIVPVLLKLLQTPEEFISVGTSYFRVLLFSSAMNLVNILYINVEKTRGRTKRVMLLNVVVLVIKLSLTAVFVYVLDGTVVLIATATLISYSFLFVFAVVSFSNRKSLFSVVPSFLKLKRKETVKIMRLSVPLMVERSAFSFGKTVTNTMVASISALSVGALGISMSISGLLTNMQSGFSDASVAVISQNDGAGRKDRVVKAYFAVLLATVTVSSIGTIILYLLSSPLIHLFAVSRYGYDESFELLIRNVFKFDLFSCIPLAFNAAATSLILGTGRTKLTFLVAFCRIFAFRIPVLYFLMNCTSLGSDAVGVMMIVSNGTTALLSTSIAIGIILREKRRNYE